MGLVTKEEARGKVLQIAKESGIEVSVAEAFAQRCWDDVYYNWKPFGGATSFDEIDSKRAADHYAHMVDEETYALRSIIENITSSEEMESADTKATAISKAADDYRQRVNSLDMGSEKSFGFVDKLFSLFEKKIKHEGSKWVVYSEDGSKKLGSYDTKREAVERLRQIEGHKKELPDIGSIKVFRDKQGKDRWLSFSSNGFMDLEQEIITTKALEEAVEYGDKTGERGPLMFFHIPGTEVGQCDYQGVAGRFLVESGTFLDTPLGGKALEYLKNSEDEHQVSIGFEYREGDERDGIYDWLRIKERSFLPFGTAANPWTDFKLVGEKEMDARHLEALEKVFGKELAGTIVSQAETNSKALEGQVAFKAKKPEDDEEEGEEYKEANTAKVEDTKAAEAAEALKGVGEMILALTKQMETVIGLGETVAAMQAEIKELKKSDDEKVAALMTPRAERAQIAVAPSESGSNVIDPKTQKELAAMVSSDNQPVNPAMAYVQDLIGKPEVLA